MRGRFWCGLHTTALALLPLVFGGHIRVAENEPKVITLSCDGMLTPTYGVNKPADSQPLQKSSVVVNLDEQIIFFLGYVAPIEDVEGASIASDFRHTQQPHDPNTATIHYELVCKASS